MCPSIGPPPSVMTGIIEGGSAVGWTILAVGTVLVVISMVIRYYIPPSDSNRLGARMLSLVQGVRMFSVVQYAFIFGGLFLVVGVANAWDSVTFAWYVHGRDVLSAQGCSTSALTAMFQVIQTAQGWIRGIGFILAFGTLGLVFTRRALSHSYRQ